MAGMGMTGAIAPSHEHHNVPQRARHYRPRQQAIVRAASCQAWSAAQVRSAARVWSVEATG